MFLFMNREMTALEQSVERQLELGERLATCAEFVREGKISADIGTDHAYLPVYLVQKGIVPAAYASDINEEPVNSARKSIARYGLDEKIIAFTGDGLEKIPPDEVDDIIIAGMGGDNIAAILGEAEWLKNPRYRLILQPMSRASRLREFLFREGFAILSEKAICEADRIYTVICAEYSEISVEYAEYDIYAGRLDAADPNAAALLRKQAGILRSMAEGCAARGDTAGQEKYRRLAERLIMQTKGERYE